MPVGKRVRFCLGSPPAKVGSRTDAAPFDSQPRSVHSRLLRSVSANAAFQKDGCWEAFMPRASVILQVAQRYLLRRACKMQLEQTQIGRTPTSRNISFQCQLTIEATFGKKSSKECISSRASLLTPIASKMR